MGYTTDFQGAFTLNRKLDPITHQFLAKLNHTRRMKRDMGADSQRHQYGIDGEFYVDGGGSHGQDRDDTIVDYNKPPSTQPSLWCQWIPSTDGREIVWDGAEKFYEYRAWLAYIIASILAPRHYHLTGNVHYQGEDPDDNGMIIVVENQIL